MGGLATCHARSRISGKAGFDKRWLYVRFIHVRIRPHQCPWRQVAAVLFFADDRLLPRWLLPHGPGDYGLHTVCIEATAEFLAFSRAMGNDLSTPIPEYQFAGWSRATGGACA